MKRATILIVDPDLEFCAQLREWLSDEYDLVMAHDGEEALASLALVRPDAVLLEAVLPGLTGPSLAWVLRNDPRYRGIAVVGMGRLRQRTDLAPKRTGTYLAKPFDRETIRRVLFERVLARSRPAASAPAPGEELPEDRRLAPRSAVEIPARLSFGTWETEGVITSLSINGAWVRAEDPMMAGHLGALSFSGSADDPILVQFLVRRSVRKPGLGGMAMSFQSLTPRAQKSIIAALEANRGQIRRD